MPMSDRTKVHILEVLNPFDRKEVRHHFIDFNPGKPVRYYLDKAGLSADVIVSVNGGVVEESSLERIVDLGEEIVTVPLIEGGHHHGKLGAVLGIVTVAVAAALPGMLGLGGWLGLAVKAAVSVGGMMLTNALFPTEEPDFGATDFTKTSPTYSWEGIRNVSAQGIPIPVLYGKTKVAGNIISKSIETIDNKQYLNLLIGLCNGKVQDITNIKINDNPIENYNDVEYETRLGTNDQLPISYISTIETDNTQNVLLEYGSSYTVTTQGDMVDGFKVEVTFPSGLFYVEDDGSLAPTSVTLLISYKKTTDPDNAAYWQTRSYSITDNKAEVIRKTFKVTGLEPAQYDIRVERTTPEPSSARTHDRVYLTNVVEIVTDDLAYPCVALLGVKALASDQLSGVMPTITCIVDRGVFAEDDPGVVATLHGKSSSNPAWVVYDILTNALYGGGLPEDRIDLTSFQAWADFCDANSIRFNFLFDTVTSVWDACLMAAKVGRGILKIEGTTISVAVDKPDTPVQLFSVGNIIKDSFKEYFLPLKERANYLEVTFWNEEHDYEREVFSVYTEDWLTGDEIKQSLTFYGVTNYEQAVELATYHLNYNRYLLRTIEFEADLDAIACTVGDVIKVQHDVPMWGAGGRIVDAGTTFIKLDRQVSLESGKEYRIVYRKADDTIIEKTFTASTTETTDTIEITLDASEVPEKYDIYAFGEVDLAYKLFRVISITRTQDFRRKITAIEYNENFYDLTSTVVPIPPETPDIQARNLTARQIFIPRPDGQHPAVQLTWSSPSDLVVAWDVYFKGPELSTMDVQGETIGTGDGSTTEFSGGFNSYPVVPDSVSIFYTISGSDYTAVDDGDGNISGTGCSGTVDYSTGEYSLTFSTAPDNGTNINASYTVDLTGQNKWYYWGRTTECTALIETNYVLGCTYTFSVCAVTELTSQSPEQGTQVSITLQGDLEAPTWPDPAGLSGAFPDNLYLTWTACQVDDFDHYEVQYQEGGSTVVVTTQSNSYTIVNPSEDSYTVYVYAIDHWGNRSAPLSGTFIKSPPEVPTLDIPILHDIDWSVSGGTVSWTAGTLDYKGETYNISSGSTTAPYIYWDLADPTVFQASTSLPTLDKDTWLMAYFDGSQVFPAKQGKILHGGLIQAGSIVAEKLNVSVLSAIAANLGTITAGKAQSADGKLIVDFDNKCIKVYDENGVLRVEMGLLS